eukprot:CAMPEP_0202104646 /NCGR_PEP_ID=MMETSP0965-20130614/5585_1 /ASSEMBLY_ACC=CAM_ASM_000507 /TAXON_ID=4773 /ORGANISM="Schizochytrium aggregatum, Strain ATCC28209" /LENGTH=162 /DNA_ID=CAMNT_0048673513 /DNA_START=23 /DNA_END=508 /DNA_ORIENTATION=-
MAAMGGEGPAAGQCVEELPDIVKMGRESALLGDYERAEALLAQAGELAAAQLRCSQRSSAARNDKEARRAVEKWRKVVKALQRERPRKDAMRREERRLGERAMAKPSARHAARERLARTWLEVSVTEGKYREVRRALDAVGLQVDRLIRVAYGPYKLDGIPR